MVISLALRNVKKHWRKSFASILAISSAIIAQTLFVGYLDYVETLFVTMYSQKQMFGDLILEDQRRMSKEGKDEPLKFAIPSGDQEKIQNWLKTHSDLVKAYVRFLNFSGMITNGKSQLVVVGRGHDFESSEKMRGVFSWNAKYGKILEDKPIPGNAFLGVQMGKWMGCEPQPEVKLNLNLNGYPKQERPFSCLVDSMQVTALTESGQINALDFKIEGLTDGVVREVDSRLIVTDLESAQTILNTAKISFATLTWNSSVNRDKHVEKLNYFLKSLNPNYHAISWMDHEDGRLFGESMSLLNVFRYFVVLIVLVITGMSVFNTSLKSIVERVREIGALLSLGFAKNTVKKLFVTESVLLCVFGNVVGLTISLLLTALINNMGIEYKAGIYSESAVFHINVIPFAYLMAFLVTLIVSGLTTYFTIKNFLNKRIVQNLNG